MRSILQRLFGASTLPSADLSVDSHDTGLHDESVDDEEDDGVGRAYFQTMSEMKGAIVDRNFTRGHQMAKANLALVAEWVGHFSKTEYVPPSIPVLQEGGILFALAGDAEGLDMMERIIEAEKRLHPWREAPARHREDMELLRRIEQVVAEHPGLRQNAVKAALNVADGRRASNLVGWLEKAGRIRRAKEGSTYALFLPDAPGAPAPSQPRGPVASHRTGSLVVTREIDLARLPYVPLPRAPNVWAAGHGPEAIHVPAEPFATDGTGDWRIRFTEKIPLAERPDPAFRDFHATADGLLLLDDLGKTASPAAALLLGRDGTERARVTLTDDVYRTGSNALGHGCVVLSREGVLHAYDAQLRNVLRTSLAASPEVEALIRRLEIHPSNLKNHLRTVALTHDGSRYLATGVDEAWCVASDGSPLWGLRLPYQDGWTRVENDDYGTSDEIADALRVMELRMPVAPADVKRRYRELAKVWHPDVNRNPGAEEKMKALTGAAALLTGLPAEDLRGPGRSTMFERVDSEIEIDEDGFILSLTSGFMVSERQAADWIYASGFEGRGFGAYLAGYSGRVIQVDQAGVPVRVYDMGGAVPRRIADTGDYLYFLTDTRLYVLAGARLHGVVDMTEAGELIVGETGFGLLEARRFRWFREDGVYVDAVTTTDPIRRVFWNGDALVVETRTRRAIIDGATTWWES